MAVTKITYSANGSQTQFTIPFEYIAEADVDVYVDTVLQLQQNTTSTADATHPQVISGDITQGTALINYTFANATTIQFNSAPANGAFIFIERTTDDTSIVTFTSGSTIRASELNTALEQVRFIAQEGTNTAQDGAIPSKDNAASMDAQGKRLENLADANSDDDAVTRAQLGKVITDDLVAGNAITLTDATGGTNSNKQVTVAVTDGEIDTAELADNAVTTAKITDSNVTTAKIADQNVTTAKIADSAVTSAKIADGTIVNADINASANIAGSKLADSSVDLDKIVDADIVETSGYSTSWASDDTKIATVGSLAARHDLVVNTDVNPPSTAQVGKQWLSTAPGNQVHKIYDGSGWRTVAVGQPYSPATTTVVRYVDVTNGSDASDVTGFLPQAPLQSIGRALDLINASGSGDGTLIKVAPGVYQETLPLRIKKNNVSIVGESMRSCFVHPTVATENNDMFEVDSGSYIANLTLLGLKVPTADQGTRNNSLDNDATYGLPSNQPFSVRFRTDVAPVILKSPYIQNCTHFSDAHFDNANFDPNTFPSTDGQTYSAVAGDQTSAPCGGGLLIDGSAVSSSSPVRSMVVDAFTQITLDGPGVLVTNNGYAQLVSFFGTFAHYHAKAKNGGQINLSNCVSDFGRYGLIADGKSPSAIATATASAANSGATTITIGAITTAGSFHGTVSRPLDHMMVTIDGVDYGVVSSTANGSGWDIVLTSGLTSNITNTTVSFALRSYISTGGHTFEFVGVGTDYSNHPDNGGVPVEANQVIELNGGKVWQSSTDHVGKFKAGDVLVVDQVSETVDLKDTTVTGNITVTGDIVSVSNGDIDLDPNGSGVVVFKGNSTKGSGQFKLNCEQNSHGITIKGPPHSAAASYTLTLPDTDGNANEVLKTDGSGNLSWAAQSAGYSDSDVDAHLNQSTAASGEVLSWNGSDYDWVAAASGGASEINDLSDAVTNSSGTTVGLGTGALANDDGTTNENTAVGYNALNSNTTGIRNVAVGNGAGDSITTGEGSVTIGYLAGGALTTQSGAVYIGESAGRVSTAANNVLIGKRAGYDITTGSGAVFVGASAGGSATGNHNVLIGQSAGYNVDGGQNVCLGHQAGYTLTSGSNNIIIGREAEPSSATVSNEITLGNSSATSLRIPGLQSGATDGQVLTYNATNGNITLASAGGGGTSIVSTTNLKSGINNELGSLTTGGNNIALGYDAGRTITSGSNTVNIGNSAGYGNTAPENIFIGIAAGISTAGSGSGDKIAIGASAIRSVTTGYSLVAVGPNAGYSLTTGRNSVLIGHGAGYDITTGRNNVYVGHNTGYNQDTSNFNVAVGDSALYGSGTASSASNVAIGYYSGYNTTTGSNNVFLGANSGYSMTTGGSNVFVGYNTGYSATTQNNITLIGDEAGYNVSSDDVTAVGQGAGRNSGGTCTWVGVQAGYSATGSANTGVGTSTLRNATGGDNVAFGRNTGNAVTSGTYNTFIGALCGQNVTTGSQNICIGYGTEASSATVSNEITLGNSNITSLRIPGLQSGATDGQVLTYNATNGNITLADAGGGGASEINDLSDGHTNAYGSVGLGANALASETVTSGLNKNTATGEYALTNLTSGYYNTANGWRALQAATTGNRNIGIGYEAGRNITTSSDNTIIGYNSGYSITTGSLNVAIGRDALYNSTTSTNNIAIGQQAGYNITTGASDNIAIGRETFRSGTMTGSDNIAIGYRALYSATSQIQNICIGEQAGRKTTTGSYSVYIGNQAGWSATTGGRSVSVGYAAGYAGTTAEYQTNVGWLAGYGFTGDETTCIGKNAGMSTNSGANNTCLGHNANPSSSTVSNEITLGNSSVATLRCNVQTISSLSDGRDKTEVEDLSLGLDFIDTLRPVKFKWDTRDGNSKDGTYEAGFIAQDLQSAQSSSDAEYLNMVMDENPDRLEASYGKLIPVLVQAIKDLKSEIETLKANA